jgi:transcriptional regulator with XRE-family HTH domain
VERTRCVNRSGRRLNGVVTRHTLTWSAGHRYVTLNCVHPRTELGAFLRARRDAVQPHEVGITANSPRRVPGLRREEVGMLAGMSPDYLRRVEQGRVLPSDAVLDAFADALRLGPAERAHVQALADLARGRQRRVPPDPGIRPTLLLILEALVPTPAVVLGRCCEVLAWNPTGAALDQVVAAQEPAARNVARRILLDPSARELYPQWDALAQEVTHVLKLNSTRFSEDRALRELIEELSRASAEFRHYWERQEVFEKTFGRKVLDHPAVGRLELEYESFEIAPLTGQVLIVYTAPPGTPTAKRIAELDAVARELGRDGGPPLLDPAIERRLAHSQ